MCPRTSRTDRSKGSRYPLDLLVFEHSRRFGSTSTTIRCSAPVAAPSPGVIWWRPPAPSSQGLDLTSSPCARGPSTAPPGRPSRARAAATASSSPATGGVIWWRTPGSRPRWGHLVALRVGSFGGGWGHSVALRVGSFGGGRPSRGLGSIGGALWGTRVGSMRGATDPKTSGCPPPIDPAIPGVNAWRSGINTWRIRGQSVAQVGSIGGGHRFLEPSRSACSCRSRPCGEQPPCISLRYLSPVHYLLPKVSTERIGSENDMAG